MFAVALGASLADTGAAALLVAAGEADAVVLIESADSLGTAAAAQIRQNGAQRFVVVGGPAAVDPEVERALSELAPDAGITRVWGQDRQATAAAVARVVLSKLGAVGTPVAVVNGWSEADVAAAAAAVASGIVGAVLYVSPYGVGEATLGVLAEFGIDVVLVIGGPAAVSEDVLDTAADAADAPAVRVGGATRVETALLIAERAARRATITDVAITRVVIVDGWDPVAATLAATIAAAENAVVLYVDERGSLSRAALTLLNRSLTHVVIVNTSGTAPAALDNQIINSAAYRASVQIIAPQPGDAAAAALAIGGATAAGTPRQSGNDPQGAGSGGPGGSGPTVTTPPPEPCDTPTGPPSNVQATATASLGTMTVTWTAPAALQNPSCAVTGYVVQHRPAGNGNWADTTRGATVRSATLSGLAGGSRQVRVVARNDAGDSDPSNVATDTVYATCPQPSLSAAPTTAFGFTASWHAPVTSCHASGWLLQWRPDGTSNWPAGNSQTFTSGQSQGTASGLAPGGWEVRVQSRRNNNAADNAISVTDDVTVAGSVPNPPASATAASTGNGEITVTWTAPTTITNTKPVTGYRVEWTKSGTSTTSQHNISGTTTLTYAITSLDTDGTGYDIDVKATNLAGSSAAKSTGTTKACHAPGPPTNVGATPAHNAIQLSWTAPTDTGECPLSGYNIQYQKSADLSWMSASDAAATATTATISGLDAVAYAVRIRASNTAGLTSTSWARATATPTDPLRVWFDDDRESQIRPHGDGGDIAGSWFVRSATNKTAANLNVSCHATAGGTDFIQSCAGGTLITLGKSGVTYTSGMPNMANCGTAMSVQLRTSIASPAETAQSETRTGTICGPYIDDVRVSTGNTKIGVAWQAAGVGITGAAITAAQIQYKAATATNWTDVASPSGSGTGVWHAQIGSLTAGTVYDIRIRLQNNANDTDDATNWWGFRRYTTSEAVKDTGSAPGMPGSLSHANHTNGPFVSANWAAPTSDGGAAISHYRIRHKVTSAADSTYQTLDVLGNATSITVTGLTPQVENTLQIRAVNANGESAWATIGTDIVPNVATRVWWSGGTPVAPGDTAHRPARLFFQASTNRTAAIRCTVTYVSDPSKFENINCPPDTLTSMFALDFTYEVDDKGTPGTSDDVNVALCGTELQAQAIASNSGIVTARSDIRTGTICGPGFEKPSEVQISAGNGKLGVAWSLNPTKWGSHPILRFQDSSTVGTDGAVITGAELQYKATDATEWTDVTPDFGEGLEVWYAQIDSLTAGKAYDIRVRMSNNAKDADDNTNWWGWRLYKTSAPVKDTGSAPGTPGGFTSTVGDGTATVNWTAPASDGGAAVAYYKIRHKVTVAGDDTYIEYATLGIATSSTISGLTNDSAHTVQIKAANANGESAWATIGGTITPTS